MMEINLLPWREIARNHQVKNRILIGILFVLSLAMIFFYFHQKNSSLLKINFLNQYSIKYVGYVKQDNKIWGLIMLPDNRIREIIIGSSPLQQNEKVISITPQHLVIQLNNHQNKIIPIRG